MVTDVFQDFNLYWAHVCENGRHCYAAIESDRMRKFDGKSDEEKAEKILVADGFSLSSLPHIEDATRAMRYLWASVMESENCMWSVGEDGDESPWEELEMTQAEFETQVDADVKKYGLSEVVCKDYEDNLYFCYGELMEKFSGKGAA